MLQQTTVAAVVPFYLKWLTRFPNAGRLARAPVQTVLKYWQGLGYYQRARNLHRAARLIVRNHGGRVPDDYDALRRLPGFGPYIAAAVMSLAFDRPYPILEANVRRVLMRLDRLPGRGGPSRDRPLRPVLESLFPRRRAGEFNQALMELGALVCRPGHPLCLACPVTGHCLAYRFGEQEVIPETVPRNLERVRAVLAVVRRGGRYLIQRRPERGLLAGLWEFPGGKVEAGESALRALGREVREELGVELGRAKYLCEVRHAYTRFQVRLEAWECELRAAPAPRPDRRWVGLKSLRGYPFPSGSAKIVDFLEKQPKIKG
jgi:A/G-specific adenine glycosylase